MRFLYFGGFGVRCPSRVIARGDATRQSDAGFYRRLPRAAKPPSQCHIRRSTAIKVPPWVQGETSCLVFLYRRRVAKPRQSVNEKALLLCRSASGDPYGTRTHVTAVKGRCLNHLTNGPGSGNLTRTDDNTGMNRVLYQLSYAAIFCRPKRQQTDYTVYGRVCQVLFEKNFGIRAGMPVDTF